MGKFNFITVMKYTGAFMEVLMEVSMAMADGKLDAKEGLNIIKSIISAADIEGVDVDLIEVNPRDDGGFSLEFPHAAVKDWSLDLDK